MLQISPLEYNQWVAHFDRYPPGDHSAQSILAAIWAMMATYLSQKRQSPLDIAPWLESSAERVKRKAEAKRGGQVAYVAAIASAHHSSKQEESDG